MVTVIRRLLLGWCLVASSASAVVFDDGGVHLIDAGNSYPLEGVVVQDSPTGDPTTVRLLPGGEVATANPSDSVISGSSVLEIAGGTIAGDARAEDDASILMTSGSAFRLTCFDRASIAVTGGQVLEAVTAGSGNDVEEDACEVTFDALAASAQANAGIVRVLGGQITAGILVSTDGALDLSGGEVASLDLRDGGRARISGGQISGAADLADSATAQLLNGTILGSLDLDNSADLIVGGGVVAGGILLRAQSSLSIVGGQIGPDLLALGESRTTILGAAFNFPRGPLLPTAGTLVGTLADSTPISVGFSRAATAEITLTLLPSFTGVGQLSFGLPGNLAVAVSADGSTVVGHVIAEDSFRWTSTEGIGNLVPLRRVEAVSGDGFVFVGSRINGGPTRTELNASRSGYINTMDVDLPGGGNSGSAYGISPDGSVIVGQGSSVLGDEAFRWTEGVGIIGLGDLPGGTFYSEARDVSADGSVVVGWSNSATNEAFRWTEEAGMVGLGFLPGQISSQAYAVSDDGTVVVGNSGGSALRWTATGGMEALDDPAVSGPQALAISGDGSVIGGKILNGSLDEAAIWDATNGWRSVKPMLESDYGLDLADWTLQEVRGLSEDGAVMVGLGTNPAGVEEGWVAVLAPPEDLDGDGIISLLDNCPDSFNPDQADTDSDGIGDACNDADDADGDDWSDALDNCPNQYNALQSDSDADGFGDYCDLCHDWPSSGADFDGSGVGDECECGDQNENGIVTISDILAINEVIFEIAPASPLCDTNNDQLCNVADILGANGKIFGAPAYCDRYPPPAISYLRLRDGPTDGFIETVESGDTYSLSSLGSCLYIDIGLNPAAESLRYDYTPPGQPQVVGALWENFAPFCWGIEEPGGWTAEPETPNCDCRPEMTEIGTHTLALTPCSVDVDFGAGESCVGNGGVEGVPTEVAFTIEP